MKPTANQVHAPPACSLAPSEAATHAAGSRRASRLATLQLTSVGVTYSGAPPNAPALVTQVTLVGDAATTTQGLPPKRTAT
jgi:hypothetical protein